MRIRPSFAGTLTRLIFSNEYSSLTNQFPAIFVLELFVAGALGLFPQPELPVNDKIIHFLVFFVLTFTFYFLVDTTRRRQAQLTVSTLVPLAVLSEIVQALLPNDRNFDLFDILANLLGSATSLTICSLYHKRTLERRRKSKDYALLQTDGGVDEGEIGDLERDEQELGMVDVEAAAAQSGRQIIIPTEPMTKSIQQELDTWDEHADDDWDEDDGQPGPEIVSGYESAQPNEDTKSDRRTESAIKLAQDDHPGG